MARLLGVEIPNEKRIEASLPYIYGIGPKTAAKILDEAGVDANIRTGQLSDEQMSRIANAITGGGVMIEGDLRREIQGHLKRLTSINSYRGIRPVSYTHLDVYKRQHFQDPGTQVPDSVYASRCRYCAPGSSNHPSRC